MNDIVVIKSVVDDNTLTLSNPERDQLAGSSGPDYFFVSAKGAGFQGQCRVYGYMSEGLYEIFDKMAASSNGWSGDLEWSSLEGEFRLKATADNLGHVRLDFSIYQSVFGQGWQLSGTLVLEFGLLQRLSQEVRRFWIG